MHKKKDVILICPCQSEEIHSRQKYKFFFYLNRQSVFKLLIQLNPFLMMKSREEDLKQKKKELKEENNRLFKIRQRRPFVFYFHLVTVSSHLIAL